MEIAKTAWCFMGIRNNCQAFLICIDIIDPTLHFLCQCSEVEVNILVESDHKSESREKLNFLEKAAELTHHITSRYRSRGELQGLFPRKRATTQLCDILISSFSHIC